MDFEKGAVNEVTENAHKKMDMKIYICIGRFLQKGRRGDRRGKGHYTGIRISEANYFKVYFQDHSQEGSGAKKKGGFYCLIYVPGLTSS